MFDTALQQFQLGMSIEMFFITITLRHCPLFDIVQQLAAMFEVRMIGKRTIRDRKMAEVGGEVSERKSEGESERRRGEVERTQRQHTQRETQRE